MLYVFEGARNSGKTYLSTKVSGACRIPRYQFDFVGGYNSLNNSLTPDSNAHSFSLGKELMIMQLFRDIPSIPSCIHDRGLMTIISWAIIESRASKEIIDRQLEYVIKNVLLDNVIFFYIKGENPNKESRNKDRWDYAENDRRERDITESVYQNFMELFPDKVFTIENNFDKESEERAINIFSNIILKDVWNTTNNQA
jgi:hypothetical protein